MQDAGELTSGSTTFSDETTAREFLERVRWPDGPFCPHCGARGAYRLRPRANSVRPVRPGVLKCRACRKQFTVTVGTIFEDTHIPLSKWLAGIHLLCAESPGVNVHQLYRMLGVSYRSAWFMARRLREALARSPLLARVVPDGVGRAVKGDGVPRGRAVLGGRSGRDEGKASGSAVVRPRRRVRALAGARGARAVSRRFSGRPTR